MILQSLCKVNKEMSMCVVAPACARAGFMHLPGASIFLSRPPNGPRPCSTNHMKGSPSLRIALSKATLMSENGDGVSLKERPTGVSVPGEGKKQWHV